MVWQRNDDQYGVSKKITRIPRKPIMAAARLAAVGLDQLAMNYSVRALTNGILDENEIEEVLATEELVDLLVKVGRWHRHGHDCDRCVQPPEGGVVIHDFLVYNPDASSVSAARADKSEGGKRGNHTRWHAKRGISDPSCEWCATGDRSDVRSRTESGRESDTESLRNPPVPGPVPRQTDDRDTHSPVTKVDAHASETDEGFIRAEAARVGIRNLRRCKRAIHRVVGPLPSDAHLIDMVVAIIQLANEPVRSVEAYVETACLNSPGEVREQFEACQARWPKAVAG
jgi:hypothetical protein